MLFLNTILGVYIMISKKDIIDKKLECGIDVSSVSMTFDWKILSIEQKIDVVQSNASVHLGKDISYEIRQHPIKKDCIAWYTNELICNYEETEIKIPPTKERNYYSYGIFKT